MTSESEDELSYQSRRLREVSAELFAIASTPDFPDTSDMEDRIVARIEKLLRDSGVIADPGEGPQT